MKTPKFTFFVTFINEKKEDVTTICKKVKGYDFNVYQWADDIVKESNGNLFDYYVECPYYRSLQK